MNKNSQIDVIIEHIKTEYGAEPECLWLARGFIDLKPLRC